MHAPRPEEEASPAASSRGAEEEECSICLSSLDAFRCTLPCGHSFHTSCVMKALQSSPACPLCREPYFEAPDQEREVEEDEAAILASIDELRAQTRRFNARACRCIRTSPRMSRLRSQVKEARRECACLEREVFAEWKAIEAAAWNGARMRQARGGLRKARARHGRLRRRLDGLVAERVGPPPRVVLSFGHAGGVEDVVLR